MKLTSIFKVKQPLPRVLIFILLFTPILSLTLFLLSASVQKYTGDLFFGKVSFLYNVQIAQNIYAYSVERAEKSADNHDSNTSKTINKDVSPSHKPLLFVHYQLSRTYFIQGKFRDSIYHADKELELYPENCRTHYIRGLTYGYMNYLDAAIKDFETFNSICVKDSWAGHNDLAWFYFRKGDMPKVIEVVREVLYKKENYLSPWLQNTYGVALMNTGAYKEASEAFRIAKFQAESMSDKDWGKAYPGNNPLVYQEGRRAMLESIYSNIKKNEELMAAKKS